MTDPNAALETVKQAAWLKRPAVRAVYELLDGDLGHVRAVGGIVRNTILGRPHWRCGYGQYLHARRCDEAGRNSGHQGSAHRN